jgi:hypothetical protein
MKRKSIPHKKTEWDTTQKRHTHAVCSTRLYKLTNEGNQNIPKVLLHYHLLINCTAYLSAIRRRQRAPFARSPPYQCHREGVWLQDVDECLSPDKSHLLITRRMTFFRRISSSEIIQVSVSTLVLHLRMLFFYST